ncbi:glycerate kinase [Leifsonia sp. NPDC058230]|uniref:glycerate kinase n=1 Tax=Leifsonia sp. NPDC058230 TaxID=3346391 RepID=UPI0036DD4012
MRILIAPDSFKGSATATQVAQGIAEGWHERRPSDDIRLMPMADGGEGTVDAFALAVAGSVRKPVVVTGPDNRDVRTEWVLLPDGTAVVELASASGITLLDPLAPLAAHSLGFGQVIAAALDDGAERLLLAIGGSASTDGGAGALTALGAEFRDEDGSPLPLGGGALGRVGSVDLTALRAVPEGGAIVLSDVTNPLLGPFGAAAVFGPQKGATPDDVAKLELGLTRLAGLLRADPRSEGAGAAGGVGFGLLSWGAELAAGAEFVGALLGVPDAVAQADVVITGEGRFDSQSAAGKVPSYIAGLARSADARALLVAGLVDAPTAPAFADFESLSERAGGSAAAIADPVRYLREAGAALADRQ